MITIKHQCENCTSRFTVGYEETICESDPTFCPFCAEMMFIENELDEDEND